MDTVSLYLFTLATICFVVFILQMLNKTILRIFPEKYEELKHAYPDPLKKWKSKSSYFTAQGKSKGLGWRSALTIDVYADMLIVSTMGQGLVLPYDQYVFCPKNVWVFRSLVIENIPVHNTTHPTFLDSFVKLDETTSLELLLSTDQIDYILNLAAPFQAERQENSSK